MGAGGLSAWYPACYSVLRAGSGVDYGATEMERSWHIQQVRTERLGFEPTVRLPAQRFSSSKILGRTVQ